MKEILNKNEENYAKECLIQALDMGFDFKLNADEYEFEDIYEQKESECTVEVTFRLYLCSSDYAVQIVKILKKENE